MVLGILRGFESQLCCCLCLGAEPWTHQILDARGSAAAEDSQTLPMSPQKHLKETA